jgi:DNA-binding NtrC family response regulator
MSGRARILVADDEPNIRLTARAALEAAGYEVVEAADGEEAVARHRREPADVILLDLRMPRLDGMELLRQLRDAGDPTPVVVVTAHGAVPDAVAAMRLGAADFLAKPMTPEALRRVVSGALGREPVTPATAASRLAEKLARAGQALGRREFDEAEFFLDQALDADPRSAAAARLAARLHQARRDHEGPFHGLRDLFPVGRTRRERL